MASHLRSCLSTISQKQLVAVAGLAWSGFVLSHMLGNLLIFVGPEAYNKYSHALTSNPAIYLAEAGLVAFLLLHIIFGIKVTLRNWCARTSGYAVSPASSKNKGASMASRTMIFHGTLLFFFIVYHLITFKYGPHYSAVYDGVEMRDLYRLVVEVFQNPAYVVGYTICLIGLGLHLSHGFSSSFQTLGFNHPKYDCFVKGFGYVYAVGVTVGFIAQPLYVFFVH